jgi:histone acetyltransferase (RNA polymerase elongator complex component)
MPELACPQQCSFCDQRQISGKASFPAVEEIIQKIETHLASFTCEDREVEIAFFGGTFTGLPLITQEKYLAIARNYIGMGFVTGIRLSTRPDYIDEENLHLLKLNGVTTIELGAQSLDDEVLIRCNRGHTAQQVADAAEMINRFKFSLGLQMMIGLPGDTPEKSYTTAQKIIALGALETRIYPCLVIKNTKLAKEYAEGFYKAMELSEAVGLSAELLLLFEQHGVKVIRLGLHRSENLHNGAMITGPYHISFKELVLTEIWNKILLAEIGETNSESIHIQINPAELNFAIGYQSKNKKVLMNRFRQVKFSGNNSLIGRDFILNSQ